MTCRTVVRNLQFHRVCEIIFPSCILLTENLSVDFADQLERSIKGANPVGDRQITLPNNSDQQGFTSRRSQGNTSFGGNPLLTPPLTLVFLESVY